MRQLFGTECIRAVRTHAKFVVVRNEEWAVVVRTSMNLNENPRLENIEITTDAGFADFFESIVADIFDEVPESERRSQRLELKNIVDNNQFLEIPANHIERATLNEPSATHTLKKL